MNNIIMDNDLTRLTATNDDVMINDNNNNKLIPM